MEINLNTMTNEQWTEFLMEVAVIKEKNNDMYLYNLIGATMNCCYNINPYSATSTVNKDYQYLSSFIRLFNEYCKLHNYELSMYFPKMICWDKDDHKGVNSGIISETWLGEN